MENISSRLKKYIHFKNLSIRGFEKSLGWGNSTVNNLKDKISTDKLLELKDNYPDLNLGWMTSGMGAMIVENYLDDPFAPRYTELKNISDKRSDAMDQLHKIKKKSETTNKDEGFIPDNANKIKCYTTVIPIAGQAGLFQVVYDDTYIEQNFQKEEIWVLPEERGDYTDLGVNGDSMLPTLQHGDRVRCKDVQRLFWRDSNIFKDKIYCFWHNKRGIIYKRVKKYTKGIITLSSDNPDKNAYPDFEIDIDHCSRILVVTELVSRKNI